MGGAIGKYKKRMRVSEQLSVLDRLKQQRENIIEYQLDTEEAIDMDRQTAIQLLREGRRDEAKKVLMRKRSRERHLQRSNAQLDKVDQLTEGLEVMTKLDQQEEKAKRGKWKLFFMKHKKLHQNTGLQSNTVTAENIEIQCLDGFKKKEKQKILANAKKGIEKQEKIDDAIYRMRTESSNEAIDKAVEDELEAILHADYQLPEMSQEYIQSTEEDTYSAEIAIGA